MTAYRPRLLDAALARDLASFPVVVLTGARQTGKSTLAREGELLAGRPYLSLDDLAVREQAASAPEDLLRRHPRMVLDEVQRDPSLLLAVKALVDRERPRTRGRFVLTGSANLLRMDAVSDSLAGRAAYRTLHPLTRREQRGLGAAGRWGDLFDTRVDDWPDLLLADDLDDEDWRSACRRGGFPVPALELTDDASRSAWFEGYVRTYLERDLRDLAQVQGLADFRRLMRAAALRTGTLLNAAEIARDVGMPATTVGRHLGLLETGHLLHRIEAYSANRTKRLIKAPKL